MVISANARLLTKMGRVYIYSKQRISKGMFDDDEFRAMCQAFYEAGGGRDTAPGRRSQVLLKYVNAVEEGAQTGRLCSPVEEVHKQAIYFSQSPKRWENMMEVADRVRCVNVSCIVPYNDAT